MKYVLATIILYQFSTACLAQIKVDSRYTVMARGAKDEKEVQSLWLGDLNGLLIKEKASGKICPPVAMSFTFVIHTDSYHAKNTAEAQKYLDRLKPGDKVIVENIKLADGCFIPPKEIVWTIQ